MNKTKRKFTAEFKEQALVNEGINGVSAELADAVGIDEDAARSKMTRLGSWDSRKVVSRCVMVCEFLL